MRSKRHLKSFGAGCRESPERPWKDHFRGTQVWTASRGLVAFRKEEATSNQGMISPSQRGVVEQPRVISVRCAGRTPALRKHFQQRPDTQVVEGVGLQNRYSAVQIRFRSPISLAVGQQHKHSTINERRRTGNPADRSHLQLCGVVGSNPTVESWSFKCNSGVESRKPMVIGSNPISTRTGAVAQLGRAIGIFFTGAKRYRCTQRAPGATRQQNIRRKSSSKTQTSKITTTLLRPN